MLSSSPHIMKVSSIYIQHCLPLYDIKWWLTKTLFEAIIYLFFLQKQKEVEMDFESVSVENSKYRYE